MNDQLCDVLDRVPGIDAAYDLFLRAIFWWVP